MILITSVVLSLFIVGSCNEELLESADRAVADANNIAAGIKVVLESPAGPMIPPDWRLYGSLAVLLTSAAANGYQKWRGSQMTKTTKAIVKGIEAAEKEMTPNPTDLVKQEIANEMRAAKVYDVGNEIVDRLKIS